ncbi:hypothetical protein BHM03_00058113 [Ensete ventricosum]|uniref:Uncharacterized protein n=1 Tax=Ensete ventricosum TaxID=4639 RepID=A0A445MMJ7_ENSVE|nr:hypothetical protein BHM03_00058113 [Ensete ventricosum]
MFYKAAQEEKPRNYYFDKHSSSSRFQPLPGVAAFEPNQKSSHAVASQVCAHRARAIMLLASKGSNVSSNAIINPRSEAPLPAAAKVLGSNGISAKQTLIPTPIYVVPPPCSGLSSPISVASHAGGGSNNNNNNNNNNDDDDAPRPRAVVAPPLVPTGLQDTSKTSAAALGSRTATNNTPRAVPQARKASLARFLEKRKERMTNALPYPSCSKMTKDNGRGFESCNSPSKSSSAEISLSTYREDSWFLAHPKSSIGSSMESIGTKLTI